MQRKKVQQQRLVHRISEHKLVKQQRSFMPKEIYILPDSPCYFYCTSFFLKKKYYASLMSFFFSRILNKIKNMSLDYIRLEDELIELEGAVSTKKKNKVVL